MGPLRFLTTVCVANPTETVIPIGGLQVWLDAADSSTVTIATGVSSWRDKSGTGNTVVQATGALQPTYESAVQNGLNIVRFNGTTQYLAKTTPSNLVNLTQCTGFLVAARTQTTGTDNYVGCFETVGNQRSWCVVSTNGSEQRKFFTSSDGSNTTGNASSGGTTGWGLTYFTLNVNTQSIFFQGVTSGAAAATTPILNSTSALYIGINDPVDGNYLTGDIGEFIFYNRLLSAREIAQVNSYLQTKWNVS